MLYNKAFADACEQVYSPRNAFCISRNDGRLNQSINIFKDTVINLNGLLQLSSDNYTASQVDAIHKLQAKYAS